MSNLSSCLKESMQSNIEEFNISKNNFFICRKDGVLLYNSNADSMDNHSIGALIGGVWQAALALVDLGSRESSASDYRLNFSTSKEGFYILPLFRDDLELYFGISYKNQSNPAQLWHHCRKVRDLVLKAIPKDITKINESDQILFQNITDKETPLHS